jgi:hypothetical protein
MANPTPTAVQQTLPAPYIEGAATALTEKLLPLLATPINTASYAQQIAPQAALTQQAQSLAGGLGAYQPYLQQAGALGAQAEQTLGGLGQYMGPQAYQQFMSPYQQEIINTTLANYDVQAQKGLSPLSAQAIGAGAFGGAREGIQRANYQTQSDLNRAQLQAQLLGQGFSQAQQQAGQAYQQQLAAAQAQQGLGQYQGALGQSAQQLASGQIQGLQQLGQQQQAYQQAILDAQSAAAKEAAFSPYTQYGLVGQQLTGLMGGFPTTVQTYNPVQPVSPLQQGLGTLAGLGGIAGKIFG